MKTHLEEHNEDRISLLESDNALLKSTILVASLRVNEIYNYVSSIPTGSITEEERDKLSEKLIKLKDILITKHIH